jgi:GH24 family phage-related lysozyme (muramidase)
MSTKQPVRLLDLFRYYKGLPHQMAAITELQEAMPAGLLSRDNGWFKTWSVDGKQAPEPAWWASARGIVSEFEGCELTAYPDPGTGGDPWTIGYGHTGPEVQPGMKITKAVAEDYLRQDLQDAADGVFQLLPLAMDWRPQQQAALISFAFNVGLGGLGDSTLRRRLLAGEDPATAVKEELPRWNKGGHGVMPGLTRRRAAEVALFCSQPALAHAPQQPAVIRHNSPFTARLTPNVTLGDFALQQDARRFQQQHQVDTAALLANFLERVKRNLGGTIVITSGYRPPAINRSVGGASASEHLFDAPGVGAVDFYLEGVDINKVQAFCDRYWDYSVGYGAPKGFVHLGIRKGKPRLRWDY